MTEYQSGGSLNWYHPTAFRIAVVENAVSLSSVKGEKPVSTENIQSVRDGERRLLRIPFEFGHSAGYVSDKSSADNEEFEAELEFGRDRQCQTDTD